MTLTLSPEIERLLNKTAARQGRTPQELTELAVREKYALPAESHEEKKARIYALMGSSSDLGPSQLIQNKDEEIAREDRRP